ncbi:10476_t:CDS:2 [Paraglomus brasilianum]|uniref:10476_t:CDS:1 n=1 Tax=Paraglomus brasilianum TaxID=144538 RepID=A0A9N9A2A9_9GLOM|nr:10476_t:CDS:2 [Paraglomus brasilianum]
MSSKSKLKQPSFKAVSASDEIKYRRKYKELKKKIREMEEDNEKITLKLTRAKKNIQRLRIERSFLFERLEQTQPLNDSESEQSSRALQVESEDDLSSVSSKEDDTGVKRGDGVEHKDLVEFTEKPLQDASQTEEGTAEEVPTGGNNKRRRAHKDPNAPKRPRNAFLMYCQIEREQAKEENANKGFQDVTRILSQRWKDLVPEEKKKYFDMYNKEKQRYEREMSSYVGSSYVSPQSLPNDDKVKSETEIEVKREPEVSDFASSTNYLDNNTNEDEVDNDNEQDNDNRDDPVDDDDEMSEEVDELREDLVDGEEEMRERELESGAEGAMDEDETLSDIDEVEY